MSLNLLTAHFVVLYWGVWRFYFTNFQLFQNSDLDNKQLDDTEQKAQGKTQNQAMVREKKNYTGFQNSVLVKFWSSSLKWKQRNQALLQVHWLELGAIHRHLTPFSRIMNILQDNKFIAANKMFDAKAKTQKAII